MKNLAILYVLFVFLHSVATFYSMAGAMVFAGETLRAGETEWRTEGKVLLYLGHILFEPAKSIVANEFKEKEYSEKAMYQYLVVILINSMFWGVILFGGFYLIKYKRYNAN